MASSTHICSDHEHSNPFASITVLAINLVTLLYAKCIQGVINRREAARTCHLSFALYSLHNNDELIGMSLVRLLKSPSPKRPYTKSNI